MGTSLPPFTNGETEVQGLRYLPKAIPLSEWQSWHYGFRESGLETIALNTYGNSSQEHAVIVLSEPQKLTENARSLPPIQTQKDTCTNIRPM